MDFTKFVSDYCPFDLYKIKINNVSKKKVCVVKLDKSVMKKFSNFEVCGFVHDNCSVISASASNETQGKLLIWLVLLFL